MSNYSNYGSNSADSVENEGGLTATRVSDKNSGELLDDILIELKKINVYLSLITDAAVEDIEVE